MGKKRCSGFCFSQNEIAMDLEFLEEIVRDVSHLDHLIFVIDQHLQAIPAKNESAQQNTLTHQIDLHVPAERERLDEAVDFIFDRCVQCLAQMESHRVYRLFQASVNAGDLQMLESEIRNAHADLTLGVVIGVLDNTPGFRPPIKGHDPKPVGREVAKARVTKLLKTDPTDDSKGAVVIYSFEKTTLASAVFKTRDFKAYKYCKLNMDANCSNDDIKQLKWQILRDPFGQGIVVVNSYEHGHDQLTEAFRKDGTGGIFMFIDNVLTTKDLTRLLPTDLSCLPSGMRILLNTGKLDQTDLSCLPSGMRILLTTRKLDQTGLPCLPSRMRILLTTRKLDHTSLSCLPSGMRILLTTRKLDQTGLSCLLSGMRILLTTRKFDQTDMLSRTDFEGVPYEVYAFFLRLENALQQK